jgi:hypothetical protein
MRANVKVAEEQGEEPTAVYGAIYERIAQQLGSKLGIDVEAIAENAAVRMLEDATGETLDEPGEGETPTQREIEQAQRIVEQHGSGSAEDEGDLLDQYGTGTESDFYDGDGD